MIQVIGNDLFQWDLGRSVCYTPDEGVEINELHFAHQGDAKALVREVAAEGGTYTTKIPNILLQSGKPVRVWAVYAEEGFLHNVEQHVLPVRKREKPADYIYTEAEVLIWKDLDKRLKAVEKGGIGGGANTLTVTVTDDVASHTSEQIYAHVQSDGMAELHDENFVYFLSGCCPDYVTFEHSADDSLLHTYLIYNDGTFDYIEAPSNAGLSTTLGGKITRPTTAKVGQTIVVKSVDESGKPIAWECTDLPTPKDGEDGVSVTHSWDGTTLIVTSASGTSSADLKGEKGETGDSGVYLLAEGETLEDAPAEAAVVVDPYGTADESSDGMTAMQPLIFTGAVSAVYDGSEAVSVEIPSGSGGGFSDWELLADVTLEEAVKQVRLGTDINEDAVGFNAKGLFYRMLIQPLGTTTDESGTTTNNTISYIRNAYNWEGLSQPLFLYSLSSVGHVTNVCELWWAVEVTDEKRVYVAYGSVRTNMYNAPSNLRVYGANYFEPISTDAIANIWLSTHGSQFPAGTRIQVYKTR